ncbi:MAG: rod shape-determining protein MreC [Nocardioidaceae bacterium]
MRTLLLLLLASFTVITLDAKPSEGSPVDPMRSVAGAVIGPLETGAAAVLGPVRVVPRYFADVEQLRDTNRRLRNENDELRASLRSSEFARNRADQLDHLLGVAEGEGHRLVPAQVTAFGSAQSFSRTVTIDAGREDGVHPDMTVRNGDGLVGRVIGATRSTATVLLIIDRDSVVGGRLGRNMELGFISGDGDIGDHGRLRLDLVDNASESTDGDTVVTWGSRNGEPYVAGVPIGSVSAVMSSPRELSQTVIIDPYVDFSSLDLVSVVVGTDGRGGRETVRAGGGRP